MAAIVISQVTVTNPEQYEAYKPLAKAAIEAFGGRYHVRGSTPDVLEGAPANRRYVVVEFNSVETARKFYDSELYRKAKEARKGAAVADIVVLEGV